MKFHGGVYKLDWYDDFSGSTIDTTKWVLQAGGDAVFGSHDMYYTTRKDSETGANAYIQDGKLVIEARQESYLGESYTSAMIRTYNLKSFDYGSRIDIRAKIPYTKGCFPAFWLSSQDELYTTRQHNGEIDILEHVNSDNKVYGTVWCYQVSDISAYTSHTEFNISDYKSSSNNRDIYYDGSEYNLSTTYNIYSLVWDNDKFQWLFNGKKYHEFAFSNTMFGNIYKPFQTTENSFYLRMNVAVGGSWAGSPDITSVFPQKLYVDYVKYYRRVL